MNRPMLFGDLKADDLFLNGISREKSEHGDRFGLADAVGTVGGLVFGCGVPPRIEVDDDVSGC